MAGVDENGLDGVTTALITEPVQNPIEQWFVKMNSLLTFDFNLFGDDVYDPEAPLPPGFPTIFVYAAEGVTNKIGVRESPALTSPRTGQVISPGEKFGVDRVIKVGGVQFAVLSSGGFLGITHPRTGVVLIKRESPILTNHGEVGMMDIKGLTKCCKELSAEIVAVQYWRDSALVQFELLDGEAQNRENELSDHIAALSKEWAEVTEGFAPPKLMNHVGAIDASAEEELNKVKRVRKSLQDLLKDTAEADETKTIPLTDVDVVKVNKQDLKDISNDLIKLNNELRKLETNDFNPKTKTKQLLTTLSQTQNKLNVLLLEDHLNASKEDKSDIRQEEHVITEGEVANETDLPLDEEEDNHNDDENNNDDENDDESGEGVNNEVKEEKEDDVQSKESVTQEPDDQEPDDQEPDDQENVEGAKDQDIPPSTVQEDTSKEEETDNSDSHKKDRQPHSEEATSTNSAQDSTTTAEAAALNYNSDSDAEGGFEDF